MTEVEGDTTGPKSLSFFDRPCQMAYPQSMKKDGGARSGGGGDSVLCATEGALFRFSTMRDACGVCRVTCVLFFSIEVTDVMGASRASLVVIALALRLGRSAAVLCNLLPFAALVSLSFFFWFCVCGLFLSGGAHFLSLRLCMMCNGTRDV